MYSDWLCRYLIYQNLLTDTKSFHMGMLHCWWFVENNWKDYSGNVLSSFCYAQTVERQCLWVTLKSYDIHPHNYIRCVGRKGCITGLWHSYATYSTESSQKKERLFNKPNTKDRAMDKNLLLFEGESKLDFSKLNFT